MDITYNCVIFSDAFLLYLWVLIPIVYNIIIFLIIARKDKTQNKHSKLLFILQIISFGFIIGSFFIPTYFTNNINIGTELPIIFGLGLIYLIIFVFPYVITQGLAMTLYGLKKKGEFNKYLMTSGIMILVYYLSSFIWMFIHGVIYVLYNSFDGVMQDWWLYNFMFIIFPIIGYIFFIKYSFKTKLIIYRNAGIFGIFLIISLELLKWFFILTNL
ncbi:MAG: hypothetical protein ACFFC1_01055 [Promethearchaeota archaeon]